MAEKLIIAGSVTEAMKAKSTDSVFLAGGTEINRLNTSVEAGTLISVRKLEELRFVKKENGLVWLGAATTFQEAIDASETPAYFKEACSFMASRTKRNMATIGGNVALLRDDSYIVPCLIAAKATVVYLVNGKEETGCICCYMAKARKGELKDALILKIGLDPKRIVLSKRYANTAMSYSRLNISYGYDPNGKAIAIGAAIKNAGLYKLEDAERLSNEQDALEWAKNAKELPICSDMYGSEEYKRYLLGTTIAKFIEESRKEVLA